MYVVIRKQYDSICPFLVPQHHLSTPPKTKTSCITICSCNYIQTHTHRRTCAHMASEHCFYEVGIIHTFCSFPVLPSGWYNCSLKCCAVIAP